MWARFEAAGVYGPKLTGGLCSRGGGYWLGNFAVVTGLERPARWPSSANVSHTISHTVMRLPIHTPPTVPKEAIGLAALFDKPVGE